MERFYAYLWSDTRVNYKPEFFTKDKPLPLGAANREACTSLINACVTPLVAARKFFTMTQAQKQQEAAETKYAALIAQLPAEMQSRIVNPTPVHLQAFEDMIEDIGGLRYNLTKLLVEFQRKNTLDWDDDDFEDFHLLMAFLEQQQYCK